MPFTGNRDARALAEAAAPLRPERLWLAIAGVVEVILAVARAVLKLSAFVEPMHEARAQLRPPGIEHVRVGMPALPHLRARDQSRVRAQRIRILQSGAERD